MESLSRVARGTRQNKPKVSIEEFDSVRLVSVAHVPLQCSGES